MSAAATAPAEAALEHLTRPIAALLADSAVTEVLINGPEATWIERDGRLQQVPASLAGAELRAIARLIATLSHSDSLDRECVLEGRWRGWRATVVLPPVSGEHVSLALRRHRSGALPLDAWAAAAPPAALARLRAGLAGQDNILVAGATGSGKTTLLASMLAELGSGERLVCLEDTPELPPLGAHQLCLQTRAGHNLRSLVRVALRLRPDRLVIGEVRGGEAFDLLQAMATGHRGCLGTLHADSPRGALARFEQLVLTSGLDWPVAAVREQIARSVQLLVQVRRSGAGRAIGAVTGVHGLAHGDYLLSAGATIGPIDTGNSAATP